MGVREIPKSIEYTCDGCGAREVGSIRPREWSNLHLARDAYDWHGVAVADGSIKRLLCAECSATVVAAINASLTKAHVPS